MNTATESAVNLPAEITGRLIKAWEQIHGVQCDLADFGTGYDDDDDEAARLSQAQFEKVDRFRDALRKAAQTLEELTAAADFWREDEEAAAWRPAIAPRNSAPRPNDSPAPRPNDSSPKTLVSFSIASKTSPASNLPRPRLIFAASTRTEKPLPGGFPATQ